MLKSLQRAQKQGVWTPGPPPPPPDPPMGSKLEKYSEKLLPNDLQILSKSGFPQSEMISK